jgi:hypothetical protein
MGRNNRNRKELAAIAAQLMYSQEEKEYFQAKRKAAKRLGLNSSSLPANREIREAILETARIYEGEDHADRLREMRIAALKVMIQLDDFHPKLIGSVLTGHIHKSSDIDLHVFSDDPEEIAERLDDLGVSSDVEYKVVKKHGDEREFVHIHFSYLRFNFELTVYKIEELNFVFTSSITMKPIERAKASGLVKLIRDFNESMCEWIDVGDDLFDILDELLEPLAHVQQNPQYHPEGDALYHSLQVFDLAKEKRPDDYEFLLAALLHDVGKAIDPQNHVEAALAELEDLVSERVYFLIAHHMNMLKWDEGRLSKDIKNEIKDSGYLNDLKLLRWIDNSGREDGVETSTLEEAIEYLRMVKDN